MWLLTCCWSWTGDMGVGVSPQSCSQPNPLYIVLRRKCNNPPTPTQPSPKTSHHRATIPRLKNSVCVPHASQGLTWSRHIHKIIMKTRQSCHVPSHPAETWQPCRNVRMFLSHAFQKRSKMKPCWRFAKAWQSRKCHVRYVRPCKHVCYPWTLSSVDTICCVKDFEGY